MLNSEYYKIEFSKNAHHKQQKSCNIYIVTIQKSVEFWLFLKIVIYENSLYWLKFAY